MAGPVCFQSLQGLALRATKLDSCCNPIEGECSTVVSESYISLALTAEIEAADEFTVKLANGSLCLSETGSPTLKRYNVVATICRADPDLLNIFAGLNTVLDWDDNPVGFQVPTGLSNGAKFALEFWTRVPSDICEAGADVQYLYWLLPCLEDGQIGDFTVENGPMNFTLTANATPSSTWGVGPYDVVGQDISGTPGPLLEAIPDDVPLHVSLTVVPPPVEQCGCQPLVLPS
jgi:hypothetical protein